MKHRDKSGSSLQRSYTTSGPGIMRHRLTANPAGSKRVKRFIRDAEGENVHYRRLYKALTGKDHV
jgi:hypothetical protein